MQGDTVAAAPTTIVAYETAGDPVRGSKAAGDRKWERTEQGRPAGFVITLARMKRTSHSGLTQPQLDLKSSVRFVVHPAGLKTAMEDT